MFRRVVGSKLSVIDARPFLDHGTHATAISNELRKVGAETGFFYLQHNIPPAVINLAVGKLKEFFALPLEEKMKIHVSKQAGFRGYSSFYEQGTYGVDLTDARVDSESPSSQTSPDNTMDHKEVYHMGTELSPTHRHYHADLFAENVFPRNVIGFEPALRLYYSAVLEVSNKVFSLLAMSFGLHPDYFRPLTHEGMDSMNCIHYPPFADPQSKPTQMGIGAHTDFECFTLLWQQPDGPQSLDIYMDGEWCPVPPIEGTFVVNIGDMLARWTNNHLRSTVHRSRVHPTQDRYSIAFFRACNYDTPLSCLVPNESPKYPTVSAGEHLLHRIAVANSGWKETSQKA